jgi:hypothetical protein
MRVRAGRHMGHGGGGIAYTCMGGVLYMGDDGGESGASGSGCSSMECDVDMREGEGENESSEGRVLEDMRE